MKATLGGAVLVLLLAGASQPSPSMIASSALRGLWGYEWRNAAQVRGTLLVDERTSPGVASIDGYAVALSGGGAGPSFALPADAGSFRGTLLPDGQVAGTWFQPPTLSAGVRYATPVRLRKIAPDLWTGSVNPLPDRVDLFLVIAVDDAGLLRAFIRDPNANSGAGRLFEVSVSGTVVTLRNVADRTDMIGGSFDSATKILLLDVPGYGSLTFTPRSRDTALGFYPRTPSAEWHYRVPVPLEDGWSTSSLRDVRIDPLAIYAIVRQVVEESPTSSRSPYIQALLIARHRRLALDEYFYGFDADRTHDLRSASKSFTGLMTGIALNRGAAFSLDSPVVNLFRYPTLANPDARKQHITVENLLTMSSGLACDDNDDDSPGNEDRMYAQTTQPDYYKYGLDLPMARAPGGTVAVYCTVGINLLGGVIRSATHMPLVDFFERYVAEPLQIERYHVNLMPDGDSYAGGGLYLRPRDALKLGQLYLDGGKWNGRRVVSAAWIEQSTTEHSEFAASAYAPSHGYGFAWHLFSIKAGGREYREYMAQGNGGQLIAVLPQLDTTILIMAGNYNNFPTWRAYFEQLVPQIAAAVR
jgi:CubicO group peptidase (beta-lactamase class C family)